MKKDDRIDVLHIGVKFWQDNLAQDIDANEATAAGEKAERDMDDFLKFVYRTDELGDDLEDLRTLDDGNLMSSFALG